MNNFMFNIRKLVFALIIIYLIAALLLFWAASNALGAVKNPLWLEVAGYIFTALAFFITVWVIYLISRKLFDRS